jgi:hypothetical protein
MLQFHLVVADVEVGVRLAATTLHRRYVIRESGLLLAIKATEVDLFAILPAIRDQMFLWFVVYVKLRIGG